jgi:enterobacteria phage integrase
MPRKWPKHVDVFTDRHGTVRVYFRQGKGLRVPLPGLIGSPEFMQAYHACLKGELVPTPRPPPETIERVKPGTIAALIREYYRSSDFKGLKPSTQHTYRNRFAVIERQHGRRTVAGMTRENILKLILQPLADKPGNYNDTIKKLHILARCAVDLGWLKVSPMQLIRRRKTKEIRAITEAEVVQFRMRWPVGTKQRLAFELQLNTGQRRSDVYRMTWADIEGGAIRIVQQKTGAKLLIPLHPDLALILAQTPQDHAYVLRTEFGKPFTVDGYSSFMRKAFTAAGLPIDASPHGLRKRAAKRLAEVGCTGPQIQSITGHKTLAEVDRYIREAEQEGRAADAMAKWAKSENTQNSQTGLFRVGEIAKTKGESKTWTKAWRALGESNPSLHRERVAS